MFLLQLTPVEKYAVHLVEDAMSEFMDWQLKAAEVCVVTLSIVE